MKKRVLIFPCGSEIGLELNRALAWSTHFELIGASSDVSNHGPCVFKRYVGTVPQVDHPEFISGIRELVQRYAVDVIFPAHDSVQLKLAEHTDELGCKLAAPPLTTCQLCRSKRKTYDLFRDQLRTPTVYAHEECRQYPVFLKPDVGQGSKGTAIAHSQQDVDYLLGQDPSLLVLEYLPGKEYTVDCFTDRNGKLRFVGGRTRNRISNGISVNTRPCPDSRFRELATRINATLSLRGAWFFQVKEASDTALALLEIGPRVGGAMALFRNLGVNFPLLTLFDLFDHEIEIMCNDYELELDRALTNRFISKLTYNTVYIDLDDTLLRDGQVNPAAISFLFQCINLGIRINLLSRHQGDIHATLARHRLAQIFDTVIHIDRDRPKANYIPDRESIYIDDSFSERLSVQRQLGIPVFDLDALEGLMRHAV